MVINRSAPAATVVPILVYEDVGKAIDWLCGAFGFKEHLRALGRDGKISHAQLAVAEGAIMLGCQGGIFRAPHASKVSQYLHIRVEDVDGHCARSKQFGARIMQIPTDKPFGERQYTVEDYAGHRWTFSQSVADVAPEEWGATPARENSGKRAAASCGEEERRPAAALQKRVREGAAKS